MATDPKAASSETSVPSQRFSGRLIHDLYGTRQAGKINDLEARWVLACIYGEAGLRQLARDLAAPAPKRSRPMQERIA